jgi:dTDP-4-amino-4,6-dideoxygalactose transaminase
MTCAEGGLVVTDDDELAAHSQPEIPRPRR